MIIDTEVTHPQKRSPAEEGTGALGEGNSVAFGSDAAVERSPNGRGAGDLG